EARKKDEDFKPDFEFKDFPYSEQKILNVLDHCIEASKEITEENLEKYGAEKISASEMRSFFSGLFQEMQLYVKLSANVEDEQAWRSYSEEIWPLPKEETVENSREKVREMENQELEKNVTPEELAEMFRDELDRLEVDYDVEIRDVGGCYNIPEERTVVVSSGDGEKRMYSRPEAEMLTMHEIFHAMRAYNGFTAGRESGFPDILGIHTPFYDQTEEGGAIFREHATNTSFEDKEFDYHLRLIAAVELAKSDNYREDFQRTMEKLIDLGGSVERSFYLVARNREALRHHIYQTGYYEEWKDRDEKWPLLIGKINSKWAEKFREEVEADGMFERPEVGEEKLFDFSFKD
ncbi:MAG: tyrosine/phenylalanine carboxypeptidase domain-containing protein, partial [Candidatus Nanohalobium sp.]